MKMFGNFNPLEASSKKAESSDPRNLATPSYQQQPPAQEPMRGVTIPNGGDTHNPNSNKASAVDVLDEAWNTDPSKLPQDKRLEAIKDDDFVKAAENFKPSYTEEELAQAQESPEALQALLQRTSQQALAAAATMSSKVTENYLTQERESMEARMHRTLTRTSVMNEVKALNPALTTGPFKEMTENLVSKYMSINPDVSAKEAATLVDKYVSEKLGLVKPETKKESDDSTEGTSSANWVEFSEIANS